MVETTNLKGIAWDFFPEGGRHVIRRLPFILDATGREVGPNDIFANDQAALEFVEVMAERGNSECEAALLLTQATLQQEDRT